MSINSISSMTSSVSSVSQASSTKPLTEETKKKLESLGVDTSQIKTEAQGQQKLKEVQDAQSAQANSPQGQQQQQTMFQMQSITEKVNALAAKVGVQISNQDSIEDIINNISNRVSQMTVQAGEDTKKVKEVSQYQTELNVIASEYSSLVSQQQASQNQLTGGMDNLAAYNKIFHKIKI